MADFLSKRSAPIAVLSRRKGLNIRHVPKAGQLPLTRGPGPVFRRCQDGRPVDAFGLFVSGRSLRTLLVVVVVSALLALGALATEPAAEPQVAEAVKAPAVSVVHLWAPWCGNCKAELKSGGWTKMINDNPQTQFLFVSIWNSGDDGRALLKTHEIGEQPNVMILADPGPRRGPEKLKRFLDLPVSWIPSTWVFKGGDLRYALNYGEVRFPVLQQLVEDSAAEW